jgi:hypothetical protein
MSDRNVRQISPPVEGEEEQPRRPFSGFVGEANIVLLGDPGAGKSHLFREFARVEDGRLLTARSFLNIPAFAPRSILYIDGLDERRAGRGDRGIIDAMVQKLFAVAPAKVRLSCRVADWLDESDLAAFQPFFDLGGGAVVLGLERLSDAEQRNVLLVQGINETEADAFLQEAKSRGLEEFLENPQNLLMLLRAVKSGSWPETRKELFELSTQLLLSEANREHARAENYTADELRSTAGAICAARLISDTAGISLTEYEGDPDTPSYRSLAFLESQKVQAALERRVFEAGPIAESVDYAHRTTAEFLGAAWLANTIRGGLPLGRVQALIGVDGQPAPELRGLHAWLPVFLPEHADRLIEADAYGVLTYGDAGSLTPSSRRYLLDALGRLSQIDPWFRSGRWQSPAIGALARPDMVESFRAVLRSRTANFGIRSVVVDALAAGAPLPALKDDLAAVLERHESPFAERVHAMVALLRLGPEGKAIVARVGRDRLGLEGNSLRLRSEIAAQLYGEGFGPEDVAVLMGDTLRSEDDVMTGTLWSISSRVPDADIPAILDRFEPIEREQDSPMERGNAWEVPSTFERFLFRALQQPESQIDAATAWKWLRVRRSLRDNYGGGDAQTTGLRENLVGKPALLRAMADHFLETVIADANRWMAYHDFEEITAHAVGPELFLERIMSYLPSCEGGSDKELFLYELALGLVFDAPEWIFAELYAMGDISENLCSARDRAMSCDISQARFRRSVRNTEREDKSAERRRNFEANAEAIRSGSDLGWLDWAAQIYFGLFADLDRQAAPCERLVGFLGEANAAIAIEGFIASLGRPDVPSLERVAAAAADHRRFHASYPLVAGLDERWLRTPNLDGLPDELLRSALATEETTPTPSGKGTTANRRLNSWKSAIFEQRPELARDAYIALASAALRKGAQHAGGLRELLNEEALAPFRRNVILPLLREFPNAAPFPLRDLLSGGLGLPPAHPELLALAGETLPRPQAELGDEQRDLWLAAAYYLAPQEFESRVQSRARERPRFVFLLRDFSGYERHGDDTPTALPVSQLEFLARLTGSLFPEAPFPSDGLSGDQNPWDAGEFVRKLVNAISASPSENATTALMRLEGDSSLASYRQHTQHALANQRARWRDSQYDRPNWPETLRALTNGPPVNVRDLHALVVAHLADLKNRIAASNNDIYKSFWNEDRYGRTTSPKPEESCRDVLVGLLRPVLLPLGIMVEPEGHMAGDRRADISVAMPSRKILCELKRDYHADVWTALEEQLDRFYTIDPEARGFGVFGVFWFGEQRPSPIPPPPRGLARPESAEDMERMLYELIPGDKQNRLAVVVIDVSGSLS